MKTSTKIGAAAILAVAVVIALAITTTGTDPTRDEPTGGRTPSTSSTSPTSTTTAPEHDAGSPVPSGVGADTWRPVAVGYAHAFTDTTGGQDAWLSRLRPWVATQLEDAYRDTDVRLVPTETFRRLRAPRAETADTPTMRVQLVYTGDLVLDATLAQDPTTNRWVVTTVVPIDASDPNAYTDAGDQ